MKINNKPKTTYTITNKDKKHIKTEINNIEYN